MAGPRRRARLSNTGDKLGGLQLADDEDDLTIRFGRTKRRGAGAMFRERYHNVMLFRIIYLSAALLTGALPASAEDFCRAEVNSTELLIDRNALATKPARSGLAERTLAWPSRGLSRLKGKPPACESQTLVAFLSNEVPAGEIDGYCLLPDEKLGFILVPGERNFRGRCAKTTCDRVHVARDAALDVAGAATDIVSGRDTGETRPEAVLHASGAAILSGTAASVLSSLGAGASAAMSGALSPAIVGAAAVSVVAVGGTVYLCR